MTTSGKRIKWNPSEIESLASQMVAFRIEDPMMSPGEILSLAQARVLREDRRRNVQSVTQVPEVVEKFKEKFQEFVTTPSECKVEVPIERHVVDPQVIARMDAFEESLKRICNKLEIRPCELPAVEAAPEPARMTVHAGVLGTLSAQMHQIQLNLRQAIPSWIGYKLHTWEKRPSHDALKSCTKIFILGKFCCHADVETITNVVGRQRVQMHHGGFGTLTDVLAKHIVSSYVELSCGRRA